MRHSRAYSLVELMTVIAIIMIISVLGLTNALKPSSRSSVIYQARQIGSLIEEARARSLSAGRDDPSGERVFQVIFRAFPDNSTGDEGSLTSKALGDVKTNTIILAQGVTSCDTSSPQGGLTEIKRLTLPRDIQISSFFPTNQGPEDEAAAIQFKVGELSFGCGKSDKPSIKATDLSGENWSGINDTASTLVVELTNRQKTISAYVSVDRFTSGVSVSETNPLKDFVVKEDSFAPRWSGTVSSGLNVTCGLSASRLAVRFSLATDRVEAETLDSAKAVYYDIYFDEDGGTSDKFRLLQANWQPTSISQEAVYWLTTSNVNISAQPAELVFRVWAHDARGNYQGSPASNPTVDDYRDLSFMRGQDWGCQNQTLPICLGSDPTNNSYSACIPNYGYSLRQGAASNSNSGSLPADNFAWRGSY